MSVISEAMPLTEFSQSQTYIESVEHVSNSLSGYPTALHAAIEQWTLQGTGL